MSATVLERRMADAPEKGEKQPETAVERPVEAAPVAAASYGWRVAAIVALVLLAAGGWYAYAHLELTPGARVDSSTSTAKTSGGKAKLGFTTASAAGMHAEKRPLTSLATVAVEMVPRRGVLHLTGSLTADERSSVASNTSGLVAEVHVDRGSLVRKGDVLVQIDPTDAKNKLAEGQAMLEELKARLGLDGDAENFNPEEQPEVRLAKASAELAASNLRRAEEMFVKKVVSTEAFEQARTEYEVANQRYRQARFQIHQAYQACRTAEIRLAMLKKDVEDTSIRAPFDGWVAEKLVAVGEQISSGMQATKVVTLVRIDPLRLSLPVPQQDIGRVRPGQLVKFHVDSFPDRTFEARVRFIAPVVTSDTRSMVVEAVVPNQERVLRPGLFVTAELELRDEDMAVLAPAEAVQKRGEVARVFVVRDGVAREQVVALGEEDNGKVEIRSGLSGREILVAKPELVGDGDVVRK